MIESGSEEVPGMNALESDQISLDPSIESNGSQYLLDALPDSLTLGDSVLTVPRSNGGRDYILPRTHPKSPYYSSVPIPKQSHLTEGQNTPEPDSHDADGQFVEEFPTAILADRFYKWKKILKSIISYLREVAYAQEEFARIHNHLKDSVKFHFLSDLNEKDKTIVDPLLAQTPLKRGEMPHEEDAMAASAASGFMKFGSGSIQDLQVILKKYHLSLANQEYKSSKEITESIIPKLEEFRKDLQNKIKEVKSLHGDFKTNLDQHISTTSKLLNKYVAAVKISNNARHHGIIKPKHDPCLLKLQLDQQLKRQLAEENYLQQAYVNLQSAGMDLEKIIYSKIQHVLEKYTYLIDAEARLTIKNLCKELQAGLFSKPPAIEWDHFVEHHPASLMNWKSNDAVPTPRKLTDIEYPRKKSPLGRCLKAGYLTKMDNKTKLKEKGFFLLTANFLHQFDHSSSLHAISSVKFLTDLANNNTNDDSNSGRTNHGKQGQHTAKQAANSLKEVNSSLVPISSIPLEKCEMIASSDTQFTVKCTILPANYSSAGTVHDEHGRYGVKVPQSIKQTAENVTASTVSLSNKAMAPIIGATTESGNPSARHHSTFGKLLKNSKPSHLHLSRLHAYNADNTEGHSQHERQHVIPNNQNSLPLNSSAADNRLLTFSTVDVHAIEHEKQQFKKWVYDIKKLTSFNNPKERSNYLEEHQLKADTKQFRKSVILNQGNRSEGSSLNLLKNKNAYEPITAPNSVQSLAGLLASNTSQSFHKPLKSQFINDRNSPNLHSLNPVSPGSSGEYSRTSSSPEVTGYFDIPVQSKSTASTPQANFGSTPSSEKSGSSESHSNKADLQPLSPNLLRSSSYTDVTNTMRQAPTDIYKHENQSAHNIGAGEAVAAVVPDRVHQYRKHKKNLSFGSLNSLVSAKKNSRIHDKRSSDLFLEPSIREDGTDDTASGAIKLNHSIYSKRE